jgi:acylphosphatase
VQGVSYRVSLARRAKVLGLTGWVQNLPDGRVAFLVHGDAAAVDSLLDWAKRGPPLACVTQLHLEEIEEPPASTSFEIRG